MDFVVDRRKAFAYIAAHAPDARKRSVAFVHGAGLDHSTFGLQSRYFGYHGRNVLALDLPGHGRSEGPPIPTIAGMADWVLGVLDAHEIATAAIVGHSMGAMTAIAFAALRPDLIRALVLLSGTLQPGLDATNPTAQAIRALKEPLYRDHVFFDSWHACSRPVDGEFLGYMREEAADIPTRMWHTILDGLAATGTDVLVRAAHLPGFVLHTDVCEDLWTPVPPGTIAALSGATVLANLSASNVTIGKWEYRQELVRSSAAKNL